ncbi:MAG: hypothetical protein HXM99_07215 [Porphyromonadaceae bacterium]|nr:hypothetical protein [Porphyromonadaceae bacterium]
MLTAIISLSIATLILLVMNIIASLIVISFLHKNDELEEEQKVLNAKIFLKDDTIQKNMKLLKQQSDRIKELENRISF